MHLRIAESGSNISREEHTSGVSGTKQLAPENAEDSYPLPTVRLQKKWDLKRGWCQPKVHLDKVKTKCGCPNIQILAFITSYIRTSSKHLFI